MAVIRLQGRDENGLRALRNSRETVRYAQRELFEEEGLTTKEILV